MKVLGVTGGTGTGKTVVCKILKEQGGKIIDADVVAKNLQKPGGSAYNDIVAAFGEGILCENGEIDRKKLSDAVFGDEMLLKKLNACVHPHVSEEIKRRVEKYREGGDTDFVVLDVPIPIEEGFFDTCDYIWAVVANNDIRVARLVKRMDISEEEAEKRIASQMSNREYSEIADCVIENESNVEDLKSLVLYELRRFKEI